MKKTIPLGSMRAYVFVARKRLSVAYSVVLLTVLMWMPLFTLPTQAGVSSLGVKEWMEGPGSVVDSVLMIVKPATATWTAVANNSWLHLDAASQSGVGSTNVFFACDANAGPTRTGTLTIAAQTFTVTQAGATYLATATQPVSLNLTGIEVDDMAVDGGGNLYISDTSRASIFKRTPGNEQTTLVASGLSSPTRVVVDVASNLYVLDLGPVVKKWTAASSTLTTLVTNGLISPTGLAVDGDGNLYFSDLGDHTIKKWVAASNQVSVLVASGLHAPTSVAVDGAGTVYFTDAFTNIADISNHTLKKWSAAGGVTTLLSSGLLVPRSVAVDAAGNVYVADSLYNCVIKLPGGQDRYGTGLSGLNFPTYVVADPSGNLFVLDDHGSKLKELPRVFLDTTTRTEGLLAGTDALPVVLPSTASLSDAFAPTTDQPWLSIQGISNGIITIAFDANPDVPRSGTVYLFGQPLSVNQAGTAYAPPTFSGCVVQGGVVQIMFAYANPDESLMVYGSTNLNLAQDNWTALGPPVHAGPGLFLFAMPVDASQPQWFFRVRIP